MFKELFKYKDLLYMLTLRDIRIRYKQAAMGFLWALFMPVIAVGAGVIIKKAMSIVSGKPMDIEGVLSITVKVLPWTFFISSLRFAVVSLVGNRNLVTKIYFPREVLTFSYVFAALFDFLVAALSVTVALILFNIGASLYLLFVPVLILFLFLFTSGVSLIVSSANVFFRDVKYVVEILLTFGMFFTPVFYSADTFGKWKPVLMANPISSILEGFNSVIVLKTMPEMSWFVYAGVSSILVFFAGMMLFHYNEPYLAENI